MAAIKNLITDSTPFELNVIETLEQRRNRKREHVNRFFTAETLRTANAIEWLAGTELTLEPKE